MFSVAKLLRKMLLKGDKASSPSKENERLKEAFRARYHSFQMLLTANSRALEIMSEMERASRGDRAFGMSFVRGRTTALLVNVYRIIKHLDELAPGKYRVLFSRFQEIQQRIHEELLPHQEQKADRLIYPLDEVDRDMADLVGNKMANVGEIRNRLGLRVPPGFVISALAYQRFMAENDLQSEIERRLQASESDNVSHLHGLSASIQQLIVKSPIPEDLRYAILEAYQKLEQTVGGNVTVSMRSSALAEDVEGTSFAGQYRSILNVSKESLLDAYKEIVASKYSVAAMAYRLNKGLRDEDIAMCVGCMVMVSAVSGGVAYSRNPLDLRDEAIYINSVWGLPKSVVDGTVTPDLFVVSRETPPRILRKEIRNKERTYLCYPDEGICRLDLTGDKATSPSLSDNQAVEIAKVAMRLEQYYGGPQDIEWVYDKKGELYILQCRPLRVREDAREVRVSDTDSAVGVVLLAGGVAASPGVASGPVFKVEKDADLLRFPDGAVMVAYHALPKWASVLGRAAALVTEYGSVTGHLANVAREFGVPALMGVSKAFSSLPEGMVITVDADGRRIYQGRQEELLHGRERAPRPMEGSPVHRVLLAVMSHAVPLNLIDPDSPFFRPENCQTLHDITRYAHEKSVEEMFSFGKTHKFPERSAKQLLCEVPMQWWVLNLDDGFCGEVQGRFVRLDQIRSIPMLALWEGITAVPWEGPPPVDAKGFMSVMVQATANPALDPAIGSPYANKNYFMISKNYCSLNSRFGFHFSVVEALVGERPQENYVSFQFKGGAADLPRRVARAIFVADILRDYGFKAEVKEDAVFARLDGGEESYMCLRLKILGYLIIHTRQLDMIMANPAKFNQQKEKVIADLQFLDKKPTDVQALGTC